MQTTTKTSDKFKTGLTTEINDNSYTYAKSEIKNKCRTKIHQFINKMFPNAETLNVVSLEGEDFKMTKILSHYYKLKGVSYEYMANSVEIAKNNAPKGIEVIEGDILNHVYKGTEQFIWFDFMCALRPDYIKKLLNWILTNPIKNDCVFVVSYYLHSREIPGEGFKQLFGGEHTVEHSEYIDRMAITIKDYLNFGGVNVADINRIVYCNKDVNAKAKPMVQFIFSLKKK